MPGEIDKLEQLRMRLKEDKAMFLKDLFLEHRDYCVSRLISKYGLDGNDARGVFVDALLVFKTNLLSGRISHVTRVRSYLLATCFNMAKELFRKSKRLSSSAFEIERNLYDQEVVDDFEQKKKLAFTKYKELGENCQKILRLFYLDRETMEAIALATGAASANVVKVQKARCMKKWRTLIKTEYQNVV